MSILALMERDILMWIQENVRAAALTPPSSAMDMK